AVAPVVRMTRRCLHTLLRRVECRCWWWNLEGEMKIMRRVMGVVVLMALAASAAGAQGLPPRAYSGAGGGPVAEGGRRRARTGPSLPPSDGASNIGPDDTRSSIAPVLPSPVVGEDAPVQAYLQAARSALVAGRTGEAQQALEMAQTRALDRSVPLFQTNAPS